MASKGKSKQTRKGRGLLIEDIGLVLLVLGIVMLGFLVPQFPSGDLGERFRGALLSRLGLGAYTLPWPLLALGSFFMLRRSPRSWPRVLLGYSLISFGLWSLLVLTKPTLSGLWGVGLRNTLTGTAGWLAYPLGLFIISLGLELSLGWQPTRIVRTLFRVLIRGSRSSLSSFLAFRRQLKDRAAFGADVVLAKNELSAIDKDLLALSELYAGSDEPGRWRASVKKAGNKLSRANPEDLREVQADLKAWTNAVAGFTKDRAKEFGVYLKTEGLRDLTERAKALSAQLGDPINDPTRAARPLDDVRKAMALDLAGLLERHRRLSRERDLAEAQLKGIRAPALAQLSAAYHERLGAYQEVATELKVLEHDTDWMEGWRELSGKLLRLSSEFPEDEELKTYSEALTRVLRDKGRAALPQLADWQETLASAEFRARQQAASAAQAVPVSRQVSGNIVIEEFEVPEPPSRADALEDGIETAEDPPVATPPDPPSLHADADNAVLSDLLSEGKEASTATGERPAVGGIPIEVPDLDLLDADVGSDEDPAELAREVQERVRKIDETLSNFKLEGRVVSSVRGPSVTRFEVEPAPGEKITRFATLSDDLALAMAVGSVRIEAPVPGKSVIGLEVPNANRDLIRFREAAETATFKRNRARLPLILGKSIDGEMVVGDLAKMPHLLIAGSTGSGKSVAVNTLIGSLLYKFLPTELRFLLIDPKMVELTPYDGIPHLLRPVVTNPSDAAGVLLGTVAHMERRYKMMSKIGAKNLDQYNEKARNLDMPEMPHIIIIIDELADLMITSPKEVESAIMRLAQMARATGMHLVLATQRPSVDILTNLIKVNVPGRMAFAVSSGHDSRTILDSMGAERLIGMGDMLFYQPGMVKAARLQGPYISEDEIAKLAAFLRRQYFDDDFAEAYGADFDPPSMHESEASGLIDWDDDKLRDAAELVIHEGQASVSRLQRRLSVGHARAGKLMDSLEALGVVGPHVGSKPREVLVALEDLPNIMGR